MWSDLSNNPEEEQDWILKSDNVIEQVFNNICHTSKGDIFYARGLGSDLETLLFSLDTVDTTFKAINILSDYKLLDGRMIFNIGETTVKTNQYSPRVLEINTKTMNGINLGTRIGEINE